MPHKIRKQTNDFYKIKASTLVPIETKTISH